MRGLIAAAVAVGAAIALAATSGAQASCDRSATPSTLAAQISAASAGQTICLAAGAYGTWAGTNKPVTLRADGTATMKLSLSDGDAGFTLDGLSGLGGSVGGGARDITIRNGTFTSALNFMGALSGIVVEDSTLAWNSAGTDPCCKVTINDTTGTVAAPSVTLRRNAFRGGQLDGIQIRNNTRGLVVEGNSFTDMCDTGANHTDAIQVYGTVREVRIAGNYIREAAGCNGALQGISSYDGGTNGIIVEDNVLDLKRPWGIELYDDRSSIVRHNTLRYYPRTACAFNIECGQIDLGSKSGGTTGSGTLVYDNLATSVNFSSGSTGTSHHNVNGLNASFVGPLTAWAGFALAPGSAGKGAASDGLDAGIRASGASPTPTPTPTPTATATATGTPTPTPTATASPSPTATPYTPACAPTCDEQITSLQRKITSALDALK